MLKYKSNLLKPASLNTQEEYKHTFTYSLCNMNLIISVIDSLMSAGRVYRRRKKKEKKNRFTFKYVTQENRPTQHLDEV